MDGCTVNIADYSNCRSIQSRVRFSYSSNISNYNASSAATLGSDRGTSGLRLLSFRSADAAQDGGVHDIGVAREAQRLQHRTAFRPISMQRRAKVLRFRSQAPIQMRIRTEERRVAKAWSGRSDGPYDFPPAA